MRKKLCFMLAMAVVLAFMAAPASAWVFINDNYGDTGWQTYTYTAGSAGFEGVAGFVSANEGDTLYDSQLLLDNLSQCGQAGNQGFELGNYTGYTLGPASDGNVITGPVKAVLGNVYNPTEGNYMSSQMTFNDPADTFFNAFGNPGTNGSILETAIVLTPGQTFTFDWAFLAGDYYPFQDFSLFYLKDNAAGIIFQDGLGQLVGTPVPVPPAAVLFGSGLLGLVGWRRFRKS